VKNRPSLWKSFGLTILLTSLLRGADATITVHADRPGIKVSPTLYGIFFEEINRGGEGGLYAEMISNRSFEDSPSEPSGWGLIKSGDAEGSFALDTNQPLNESNPHALRLEVKRGRVGIANSGFGGIAIKSREQYVLTLYARASDKFTGPLNVTLENSVGRALATATIDRISPQWQKLTAALKSGETDTDPAARLVISSANPGTIWLDVVSLFPKTTWKDRGLRGDIADKIAAMKPAFFRFPGGCWVEGEVLDYSYHWKHTVGDVAARKNNYNIWKYFCTNGLGFHEYLQFCEDIGAEPLFVINCGMSHKQTESMSDMKPWVQDAIDAIEYCNGSATDTKWGVMRAKNGHPAPFNLKYMEVGNENGGPDYEQRYALFYDAIKNAAPQMKIIANFWRGAAPKSRPVEILDEHYYNNPGFFMANADRYDRYDRAGAKIYVGEYAVTRECGGGNLKAALGEAAFMTGMERNSDVVVMGSYAPLLCNLHYKIWNPNAINFDSTRSYGTPSYYVQQMFATNRADVVLPMEIESQDTPPLPHGGVGIGTWNTQAEFKDLKVMRGEQTLLSSSLADPKELERFKTLGGEWKVQDGAARQSSTRDGCFLVAGEAAWADYTLSVKARKISGREGFLLRFNSPSDDDYTMWNIGGWRNARHQLEVSDGGAKSPMGQPVNGSIDTSTWHDLRVELHGRDVRCFLDDKLVHEATYPKRQPIYGVAGRAGDDLILKLVNVASRPQEVDLRLDGVTGIDPQASQILLTSTNAQDENSLDAPAKVSPVTRPLKDAAAQFGAELPANSVSILRIHAK
jgi:alpha-L-arabinofuranosidase